MCSKCLINVSSSLPAVQEIFFNLYHVLGICFPPNTLRILFHCNQLIADIVYHFISLHLKIIHLFTHTRRVVSELPGRSFFKCNTESQWFVCVCVCMQGGGLAGILWNSSPGDSHLLLPLELLLLQQLESPEMDINCIVKNSLPTLQWWGGALIQ